MEFHNLTQGSPEWHAHRLTHFNASDAPAMMGCSSYKTRSQLLHEMHTGMVPEVDAATQRRFDDGHRFEALARPLAEAIIDDDLYPIVGSLSVAGIGRKLSSSYDGLKADRKIDFEHKSLNAELRECMEGEDEANRLPLQYRVQMEQQLLVADAEKCLFMASKWNGDELVEERHCWYYPDYQLRQRIIDGWIQFEADLAAYVPLVVEVKAVAAPQFGLPAVSIQVNGSIALIDNLQVFGAALTAYVERINKQPQTDQDFADLEATVKTLKNAEDALDAAECGALAQTDSIDTMRRTVAMYRDTARTNRLLIDKLVKSEKEARKLSIVSKGAEVLANYVQALSARIGQNMPPIASDFPGVVKGLKSIDSMSDKVNTELARCKIEATAIATKIAQNVKVIEDAGHVFLFSDRNTLALKDPEFVSMTVKTRVDKHQADEAARLAAETDRIAKEERAKAEAAAQARADAEIAEAAKAQREAQAEEDSLIAGIWAQARRIEGDRIGYIQKAIGYFEAGPADFANDPRPRVAEAVSAARQEMNAKLTAATLREQEASDADLAATQAIEAAKNPEPPTAAVPFATVVDLMPESVREAMKPDPTAVHFPHFATAPDLKLGQICTRLGFQVTADFLKSLGFEPAGRERAAVLFHESDFPRMCAVLVRHINKVLQGVPA